MKQTNSKKIAVKTARLLIEIGAVSFRFDPPYTYTTGMKSPLYLDNRMVMSFPEVRRKIVNLYIETIKEHIGIEHVDCVSATASAAIPHGAWIAGKLNLPMVFVRPTTKAYGKGNKMEGYMKKGSDVIIIEDHISTAASVAGNAQTIRELGGNVKYCVATTTYETGISKKNLQDAHITLFTLTNGRTIVEEAYKKKLLTKEQRHSVDQWFENPEKWASSP